MRQTQQGHVLVSNLSPPPTRSFVSLRFAPALSTVCCPLRCPRRPQPSCSSVLSVSGTSQPLIRELFQPRAPLSATAGFPTVVRGFSGDLEPMSVQLVQLVTGPRCPECADKTDSHSGTRTDGHHDWFRLHDRSFQTWVGQVQSRSRSTVDCGLLQLFTGGGV
jgi:hypothetical protein